jgi:hypothetical protein
VNLRRTWWVRAGLRSVGIFALVVVVGEALAFVQSFAVSLPKSDVARTGLLYVFGFHHVGIRVAATTSIPQLHPFGPLGFSIAFELRVALLLVTFGAGALLYLAGRRAAMDAGRTGLVGALCGLSVAPAYAVLALVASYLAGFSLALHTIAGLRATATITLSVNHLQALWWPLVIAAVAGALGGVSAGGGGRFAEAAAIGTRTFVAGLVLAFVGLLVVAAVKPHATRAYLDATAGGGLKGADGLAHTVLATPNLAMWAFVPAMGGCDAVRGTGHGVGIGAHDILCYWNFPSSRGMGTAPAPWFLFLLVPIGAVMFGVAGRRTNLFTALAGGLVFALLVSLCSILAGVALELSGTRATAHVAIGPAPLHALGVALAWGVGGSALIVLAERSLSRRRRPEE